MIPLDHDLRQDTHLRLCRLSQKVRDMLELMLPLDRSQPDPESVSIFSQAIESSLLELNSAEGLIAKLGQASGCRAEKVSGVPRNVLDAAFRECVSVRILSHERQLRLSATAAIGSACSLMQKDVPSKVASLLIQLQRLVEKVWRCCGDGEGEEVRSIYSIVYLILLYLTVGIYRRGSSPWLGSV